MSATANPKDDDDDDDDDRANVAGTGAGRVAGTSTAASASVSGSLWSTDWASNFNLDAISATISAKANEALNELNNVDVRAMADAIAERASEAAKELELRADEAFGLKESTASTREGEEASTASRHGAKEKTEEGGDGEAARELGTSERVSEPVVTDMAKSKLKTIPTPTVPTSEPTPEQSKPKLEKSEQTQREKSVGKMNQAKEHNTKQVKVGVPVKDTEDGDDPRLQEALSELKSVRRQLAAREEEIARRAEQRASLDVEQEEFAERAVAAEEKLAEAQTRINELSKQCKELKRRADSNESTDQLVKEKDELIKEVMAEGEALSKKQAEMEGLIKKLRKDVSDRDQAQHGLSMKIQGQEASLAKLTEELQVTRTEFATEKARLTKELSDQKEYYLSKLAQAKEELTDIEVKASMSRGEELAIELKTVREREQGLKDQISDLQHSLQRSTAAMERQEERFKNDLAAAEERCQAAESSHDELLRRMPESTRPLLRQIESLQLQANENAEAWAATEKASNVRLIAAESRAEAAAEREATAIDEMEAALKDKQIFISQVEKLKAELASLKTELDAQSAKTVAEATKLSKFKESFAEQEGRLSAMEDETRERESKLKQQLAQERGKIKQLSESWDRERSDALVSIAKLEHELKSTRAEMQSLETQRDATTTQVTKSMPAPMLVGDEAGLSLGVRDTLGALRSQLAARETELQIAHDQIKKLEQTRESLANELLNVDKLNATSGNPSQIKLLETQYATALEVIGELEEERDELLDRITHLRSMLDSQASRIQALEATVAT